MADPTREGPWRRLRLSLLLSGLVGAARGIRSPPALLESWNQEGYADCSRGADGIPTHWGKSEVVTSRRFADLG